jgi:class II poly(R)-hydroxyalkanoic acid synthase
MATTAPPQHTPQAPTGRATEDGGLPAAARAAFDVMLIDAAAGGGPSRTIAPGTAVALAAGLARRPGTVARRLGGLGRELARVAVGSSACEPAKGDKRFRDPAWQGNPAFRRLMQAYLSAGATVEDLVGDAELEWSTDRKARFGTANLVDALAPTNFPLTNPAVLKETIDRGGGNLVLGARRLARDLSRPPRLPATVDTERFEVGGNLAVTPGAVVLRTPVFELVQYRPQTAQVREAPLLVVPPTINKFYVIDLAPDRSLVEYQLRQGQQVFLMSWRNPTADEGHLDLDAYVAAVLEARDAAAAIAGSEQVGVMAACSGGIIAAGALGHLAARGDLQEKVASLTLAVCLLDNARAGTAGALTSREVAAAAVAESARRGYVDGKALAGVFAWLRPNDLIWSYVVNNYLLGRPLPAFDILYWNQDTVRMAAGLHRDFVHIALENPLVRAGALTVLDTPVDLGRVDVPTYVLAGLTDHIVPWDSALRSARLLGGDVRFVLSTSGHIQALVNPPGPDSRSSYRVTDEPPADGEAWMRASPRRPGSWWEDHRDWIAARSGALRDAPAELGGAGLRALDRAPGTYVHAT